VPRTTTVVIGAGHAGLAMSRSLSDLSIDHVVLERGQVANSWRTERWDSLRLLTPNWQSRLPGHAYDGDEPDGFMAMPELIRFMNEYARSVAAPVQTDTTVVSVCRTDSGYEIATDQGEWRSQTVVLASGACNMAHVPAVAETVPATVSSVTPMDYRNPDQLAEGGVLVVGASATGAQLADEIHRSGRPVTISVGEHVRLPRVYRGKDIQWWMDAAGVLDERYDQVDDIVRARHVPSPQLVGTPERSSMNLNSLTATGIRLVGRLGAIRDGQALFGGSLRNQCALADLKMNRLLDTVDEWASEAGIDGDVDAPHRFDPAEVEDSPPLGIDLTSGEIKTVLWATGYRPDYSWLDIPVFDRKGQVRHDGGAVDSPGMYLLGMNFLRRRKSSFIHGAADDVHDLSSHLAAYLDTQARSPA
jgi:putative flavoprotein involved in K+ transport